MNIRIIDKYKEVECIKERERERWKIWDRITCMKTKENKYWEPICIFSMMCEIWLWYIYFPIAVPEVGLRVIVKPLLLAALATMPSLRVHHSYSCFPFNLWQKLACPENYKEGRRCICCVFLQNAIRQDVSRRQKTALNEFGQNCTVNPLLDDSEFTFFMLKMSEPSFSKKIFLF